jgi:hypothetical protein
VRLWLLVGSLGLAGCGGTTPARVAAPIERSEVVPLGYTSLGVARAECRPEREWGPLRGARATSLYCGRAELDRALDEQASRRGGTLLAHRRCQATTSGVTCSATIARPEHPAPPAPAIETPFGLDSDALSPEAARQIAIDLEPSVARFARASRDGERVQELAFLPVGQVELGTMRARCSVKACDAEQTRAGLRAAAGGLGVPGLVGVRCVALDGEHSCVATLAASERDPEMDAAAR